MIRFTLKQLVYFIATAERKSIAEASKHVHVAQPAIASAINKLEDLLGIHLMVRHHAQGISLTPAGEKVLVEAKNLIRHAESFQENAFSLRTKLSGEVVLGCYRTLAAVFMPSIIHKFKQIHPDVKISITESDQDTLEKGIRTGQLEMAFIYNLYLPKEFEFTPIYEAVPHAVLPEGHPLTHKKKVSLEELLKEPFILLDMSSARQYYMGIFAQYKLKPNIVYHASSLEVLRGMVGWNLGVSLLNARPASEVTYDGHKIELRPLKEAVPSTVAGIARLRSLKPTKCAEEFQKFCTSEETRTFLQDFLSHKTR